MDISLNNTEKSTGFGKMLMKIVIPLIISVGLCYILFTGVDFNEIIDIIKRDCDFRWIGLAMMFSVISHIIRAKRWQIQLNNIDCKVPTFPLILSIFGTYSVNLVFPRLGELWRSGYIAQRQDKPFASIFGSMIAERLCDMLSVLIITLITFLLASNAIIDFLENYPEVYTGIAGLLHNPLFYVAVIGLTAFLIWFFRRKTNNKYMLKTKLAMREIWHGFASIATMPGKGKFLILTIAIWACYYFQLYIAFFSFPFTTQLLHDNGFIVCLVCFVLSSIAMGIPSNGGIGPWQIAVIFGLSIYMPETYTMAEAEEFKLNSTAFANIVLGAQTVLLILLGIFTFICIAFDKNHAKKQS